MRIEEGVDFNGLKNGTLLRADIHALFDAGLITLTEDGMRIQVRHELLSDPTYRFLMASLFYSRAMVAWRGRILWTTGAAFAFSYFCNMPIISIP